jgi:hypothetical protein
MFASAEEGTSVVQSVVRHNTDVNIRNSWHIKPETCNYMFVYCIVLQIRGRFPLLLVLFASVISALYYRFQVRLSYLKLLGKRGSFVGVRRKLNVLLVAIAATGSNKPFRQYN